MEYMEDVNIKCYKCNKKIGVMILNSIIPNSPQKIDNESRSSINKIQHKSDVLYIFCPECYKEI